MRTLEITQGADLRDKIKRAAEEIAPGCSVVVREKDGFVAEFSVVSATGHTLLWWKAGDGRRFIDDPSKDALKAILIDLVESSPEGIGLAAAWRQFESRHGVRNLRMPSAREIIFADVSYGEHGEVETVCLTARQMRFAVEHKISNADLVNENYPEGWPARPLPGYDALFRA